MCVPCLRIALVTSMASAPTWDKVNARTAAFRCAGMPILGLDDSECWKYVVYILECAGNCYYVGIECRDKLAKRLSQGPAPPPSRKPPRASSRSSSRSSRATEQPSNLNRTRVAHLFSAHIFHSRAVAEYAVASQSGQTPQGHCAWWTAMCVRRWGASQSQLRWTILQSPELLTLCHAVYA